MKQVQFHLKGLKDAESALRKADCIMRENGKRMKEDGVSIIVHIVP